MRQKKCCIRTDSKLLSNNNAFNKQNYGEKFWKKVFQVNYGEFNPQ